MGALQQILGSRLGFFAALCVVTMVFVALTETRALLQTNARALSFNATSSIAVPQSEADAAQERLLLGTSGTAATSSGDAIAMIGPVVVAQLAGSYAGLQDSGALSDQNIAAMANSIAKNVRAVVSFKTYSLADIQTKNDTSYNAMLAYRADMRGALQPLMDNSTNELDLYGSYVETNDATYLSKLSAAAQNYSKAAENAAALVVPKDVVNYHKDVLNALEEFGSVLDKMSSHAGDALASAALLRSYDQAEQDVYNAFNNLTKYYSQKSPS